jgi:carboxyl-terminal processing protease
VIAPLPGTPAERAGILAGDRIVEVEGQSTEGWSDEDAVKVLRGPKGTPVNIRIAATGRGRADRVLDRARGDPHQSVPSAYMIEPGIGYARLDVFSETSTEELRAAIARLAGGDAGLILDLRGNPGGLLDQGVSISDLFLDRGAIVETRAAQPARQRDLPARGPSSSPECRSSCWWTSTRRARGDRGRRAPGPRPRAGDRGPTFGKGSVQTLFPLSGGNFLKMTTGKWYTPVGSVHPAGLRTQRNGDPVALLEDQPIADDGSRSRRARCRHHGRQQYRTDGGRWSTAAAASFPDLMVRPDTLTAAEREFFQAASRAAARSTTTCSSASRSSTSGEPEPAAGLRGDAGDAGGVSPAAAGGGRGGDARAVRGRASG